jgi:CBS-domain-containing membrane protein
MLKTVAQLMSVDFVTVTARMSLTDALTLLVDSDATELCVVDDRGHFEGIVTDFDLLKSHLHDSLPHQTVGSLISRAVTVLAAEVLIDQAIPLFRDGSCSRAYICRNGRLLGRLSRTNVLRHLAQRDLVAVPQMSRTIPATSTAGLNATIDQREPTPRVPQFMTTSVLGGLNTERSRRS